MSVAYDNNIHVRGFSVVTLTTPSFTIDAGSVGNRGALLCLYSPSGPSAITGSVGGVNAVALASATVDDVIMLYVMYVNAPPQGSQTATMSWTGSSADAQVAVVTATGVDQSTAANNGNNTDGGYTGSAVSCAITSSNGDLTITFHVESDGVAASTNRTLITDFDIGFSVDRGPGTGTITHTWTPVGGSYNIIAGGNFKAAAGGVTVVAAPALQRPRTLTRMPF